MVHDAGAADRRALLAILTLAFALRFGLAVLDPSIAHPDEIFQYQEPAHRWLMGTGVETWEWSQRARSWLIPLLVLPLMAGMRTLSHDPVVFRDALAGVLSAASLPSVWVAARWGGEQNPRQGMWVAGCLAAVWFQLVYYSAHLLVDTLATDLLLPALFCARGWRRGGGVRLLGWGAALLGGVAYLRPQLAPALAVPAVATLLAAHRRGQTAVGLFWGTAPLLALGALDWATLGTPFQSVWLYSLLNLRVADVFGVSPWYWYLGNGLVTWSAAVVPIVAFCAIAAKPLRVEIAVALLILATMSAIGHKEPRFILPALAILLALAGAGLARALRFGSVPTPVGVGAIGLVSLALGLAAPFRPTVQRWHGGLVLIDGVMRDPATCGVDFLSLLHLSSGPLPARYFSGLLGSAGYTGAGDGMALFADAETMTEAHRRAANRVMTLQPSAARVTLTPSYRLQSCGALAPGYAMCVYRRAGGCG